MSDPEDWFHNAIVEGLQALHVLSLQGTPAADTIQLPALVWIDALWHRAAWDEERDAPRIRVAFVSLASSIDRWPAPRVLLEHLPRAPDRPLLPAPKLTAEEIAQNCDRARRMRQRVAEIIVQKGRINMTESGQ